MQYLCIRFRAKNQRGGMKKEFFDRFTQTEVVQEASAYYIIGTWVEETNRQFYKVAQAALVEQTRCF